MNKRSAAGIVLAAAVLVVGGCARNVDGTATWPGATLERVLLGPEDLPPGVQYDRIIRPDDEPDSTGTTGGAPAMLSSPEGCSDALTRVIAESAERGPGSAAEYVVAYDGARIVMTVLSWTPDLAKLQAAAQRCAEFRAYFDAADKGVPITTTQLMSPRPDALAYQQTMQLRDTKSSVYFTFENIGSMAVYGIAFPIPNPAIPVEAKLPQTFLKIAAEQAKRIEVD